MIEEYSISGMSCASCIEKVQQALSKVEEIKGSEVQLAHPQAKIEASAKLNLDEINGLLAGIGNYTISDQKLKPELAPLPNINTSLSLPAKSIETYKPLILIVGFIAGVSLLSQYPFDDFSVVLWMRHFMAGFFIVFAFFKLLNLQGFATSYRMYDIIAARWKAWGLIYPFVELALGILYLVNAFPFQTNVATVIILGVSSIGVVQSNLAKRKIKCACLGDVFNLPMSTVTIVEDLAMVAMAIVMLLR